MNSEELTDALSQPSTKAVGLAVARIEALYSQDGPDEFIATGLLDFDETYGGWRRGALSIVGGRPSMGRTSLVLNSAVYAASVASRGALFVTLEHPLWEITLRALGARAGVPVFHLLRGKADEKEWRRFVDEAEKLRELPLHWIGAGQLSTDILEAECRRLQSGEGLEVVFIDELQRLKPATSKESFAEDIEQVCNDLKRLAVETGLAVVATSQVNRSPERREDKRPLLMDLRNSAAIEELANLVLFLYRDEVYDLDAAERGLAELEVAKNDVGPVGRVRLRFDGPTMCFSELSQP